MVFLCFSVKDRLPLVNDFYHFLSNFGVDIWYDRRNIYIGDNRINTNINKGAKNPDIKYAILFYSDNFVNGNICLDEYEILKQRYHKGEISLFPVFLNCVPDEVNDEFKIFKKLVFKLVKNQSDFNSLALHVIAKITCDEIQGCKYKSISDIEKYFDNKKSLFYKLLIEYQYITKTNYNMRIAALFYLYTTISNHKKLSYFHTKTMNYIYHQNCMNILLDEKRELQIMENIIICSFSYL